MAGSEQGNVSGQVYREHVAECQAARPDNSDTGEPPGRALTSRLRLRF
jgi:hypothetical protein